MESDNRRNRYDKKDSLKLGDSAESVFKKLALKRMWEIVSASRNENIYDHWDFRMKRGPLSLKVDVKAMKRMSRADMSVQEEWLWIELHGVRENDRGWLIDGKADLFAFEKEDSFIIVKRTELMRLVDSLVDFSSRVSNPAEAQYKVYSRTGRPDKLTLIRMSDLEKIKWDEWEKEGI